MSFLNGHFLSIIRDPKTYERFEHVVLVHGVRRVCELAYVDFIERELPPLDAAHDRVMICGSRACLLAMATRVW